MTDAQESAVADGEYRDVGGYRLVQVIGSGGMGEVYRARDGGGTDVALKLLHPHIARDPSSRQRLAREVSLLRRVRHPGVAQVLDAEAELDEAFVVTELIDGPTLDDDLKTYGTFAPEELITLAKGLASALRSIHEVGIVHRDLKPGNVMLGSTGPVLIDFGIAQVVDDDRLTQTGMVTGTPGYLDPEVIAGADPTPTCDWWAWAAVLVHAVTARPPFGRGTTATILSRVATGRVDLEGVEPTLATALRQSLDPDPAHRLDPDHLMAVIDGSWSADDLARQVAALGVSAAAVGHASGFGSGRAMADRGGSGHDGPFPGARDDDGLEHTQPHLGPNAELDDSPAIRPDDEAPAIRPQYDPDAQVSYTRRLTDADRTDADEPPPPSYPPAGAAGPARQAGPGGDYRVPAGETTVQPGALRGAGQPYDEAEPRHAPAWARPHPAYFGVFFGLSLLLAAFAPSMPGPFAVLLVLSMLTFGTIGAAVTSRRERRLRLGVRASDTSRMLAFIPLHIIKSIFSSLIGLLVGAGLAVAVIFGWELLYDEVATPPVLWIAGLLAVWGTWLTPTGRLPREGLRATITAVLPTRNARIIAIVASVVVGVGVGLWVLNGGVASVTWPPLPNPAELLNRI